MSAAEHLPRNPDLMSRDDTALVVVDVQGKLIGLIPQHERIVWNISRLIDAAKILNVPALGTEQYPQGLGPLVDELRSKLDNVPAKVRFSCGGCPELFQALAERGICKILVVGIETHVCIQQTVLDLLHDGFRVYIAVDAVGARHGIDHDTALRRLDSAGATLTTTESAMFEWCEVAGTPEFKQISSLVRQPPPSPNPPK